MSAPYPKRRLLKVILGIFILILFFYAASSLYQRYIQYKAGQPTIQHPETKKESQGIPVRLKIPKINVDATIQQVGVTSQGAMAVPTNTVDVGWFNLGPHPGEQGSAVIAGHFDDKHGEAGVFSDLDKLKKGDKIYVEDDTEAFLTFVVQESRTYNPGYADDVFGQGNGVHLNLITCDGVWDTARKSYSKRLVVFTDMTNQ